MIPALVLTAACEPKKKDTPAPASPKSTINFDCANKVITQNVTWKNVTDGEMVDYRVACDVFVQGSAVLTIEPGVIIEFDGAGSGIFTRENGGLSAAGTAALPIKFIGRSGRAGSWQGIYFGSNHPMNQLDYVTLLHAGGTASGITGEKAAIQLSQGENSRASIANTSLSANDGYGVFISEGSNLVSFTGNTITGSALAPVAIPFTLAGKLNATTTFGAGNGRNYVSLIPEDLLDSDMTLEKLAVPYRLGGRRIFITKALTVKPGVVMEFETGTGLRLGTQASDQLDRTGSLHAVGTAADSIIFRGAVPGRGAWLGIGINSASANNRFAYCSISGGGAAPVYNAGGVGNLVLTNESTTVNISNSTIRSSGGWGIGKVGFGIMYVNQSNNVFLDNAQGNVSP